MMTSENKRLDIILRAFLRERPEYSHMELPDSVTKKRTLLRALMNVRPPEPIEGEILHLLDDELERQLEEKGIVGLDMIPPSPLNSHLRLWQGDITRLQVDAIVNAANCKMLGCFIPLHKCIDNAIHSAAGPGLRLECEHLMQSQGSDEPTGHAKITRGYNLPARWVIHTVGPIVYGESPTEKECHQLADCYRSCLAVAEEYMLSSIAFCCISTGEFHFPQSKAAYIAVNTVKTFLASHPGGSVSTVVFNVFKNEDFELYKNLLGYE